ncbi:uncharacterized protein K02A2.6-like [Harmonia axyridis]|uniref:uncharacterized protein K02A2.6-like n=1 Tax=Harmonia axyridis TaxID=115357 RepID=UPI001E2782F7|nr:uncharacterized protein K02A2.6-like [Harmonia axyridis]
MAESPISSIGHLREFDPAISEWSIFKRRIDNYFVANSITDEKRKGAILLNVLNEEAYKLVFNMCLPEEPEIKTYKVLSELLTNHFKPSESVFAARYKYYTAKKVSTETAKEWAARLRNFAAQCQFNNLQLEMVLRDVFIVNYDKGSVQDRLLEEKNSVTFAEMVELASAKSATQSSMNNWENFMKKEVDLHYAGTQPCQSVPKERSSPDQGSSGTSTTSNQQNKCEVCGRRNHSKDKCFYRNCLCHICNKKGHLAPVCKQKHQNFLQYSKYKQNFIESSDCSLFTLGTLQNDPINVEILIQGIPYTFSLDTGSSFTVVSDSFYSKNFERFSLKSTKKRFNLYNGEYIVPLGYFTCEIVFQNKTKEINIYVIKDACGPPLLGRDFFNIFQLNISSLNYVNVPDDLQFLFSKYKRFFEPGLGTFTKGKISIKLKSDGITPKFFRARPLPFAMKEKVEQELERLLSLGVIEPVDYSPWGTPVVPVLKKDGSVRLCGDFKSWEM